MIFSRSIRVQTIDFGRQRGFLLDGGDPPERVGGSKESYFLEFVYVAVIIMMMMMMIIVVIKQKLQISVSNLSQIWLVNTSFTIIKYSIVYYSIV